jgi:(2Fe-2S) ferredoxin
MSSDGVFIGKDPPAGFEKIGLAGARRHIFLCAGPTCCTEEEGSATWHGIKASVAASGLPILRTRAACLRICEDGPWLVVYPDGVWYSHVSPERFERIRREHLENGVPVADWVRAVNPLGPRKTVTD